MRLPEAYRWEANIQEIPDFIGERGGDTLRQCFQ
jgi:hypothetical protein